MLAGNWKSSRMVAHYSAGATAERGAVARYLLAAEHKALFFKDGDEVPVVQRKKAGHLGRQVDAQPIERYVLGRQPSLLVAVARLL